MCFCRAAIVYVKSQSDAKAAVNDLNGCSLQGHTVQLVRLCGLGSADPKLISDQSHSTSETYEAETAGGGLGAKGVTYSSSHGVSTSGRLFRKFMFKISLFSVIGTCSETPPKCIPPEDRRCPAGTVGQASGFLQWDSFEIYSGYDLRASHTGLYPIMYLSLCCFKQ